MSDINIKVLDHQKKVLKSETYLTSMSCGVGAGKTYTAALITILELLKGKRVLVVYPTFKLFIDVLALQMIEILNNYQIPYTFNKSYKKFDLGYGGEMFCRSGEFPDDINGLTKIDTCVFDECRLIPEIAFTYALSRQRGVPEAKIYLFGTGCSKRAWFAKESLKPDSTWIKASALDNVEHNGKEYVERLIKNYEGLDNYFIQRELYGEFVDGDEQSLFNSIETNAQWKAGTISGGLDVAINGGSDYSAATIFNGNKIIYLGKKKTLGFKELNIWKDELEKTYNCKNWCHDHTGLGNDLIINNSTPIYFGAVGNYPYSNKRAEMYFDLKFKLYEGILIDNPDYQKLFDSEVRQELEETKTIDKEMRNVCLIPKEEIQKIIRRSPDLSDSMALAAHCAKFYSSSIDYNKLHQMQRENNPFKRR